MIVLCNLILSVLKNAEAVAVSELNNSKNFFNLFSLSFIVDSICVSTIMQLKYFVCGR